MEQLTIKNLEQFTLQQVYDFVVEHLRGVAKNSNRLYSVRMYYDEDLDHKCAVGCLIPKELYQREFEGAAVKSLLSNDLEEFKPKDQKYLDLLETLQRTHDWVMISEWEKNFKKISDSYGLTYHS